jgi:hypothetical protein
MPQKVVNVHNIISIIKCGLPIITTLVASMIDFGILLCGLEFYWWLDLILDISLTFSEVAKVHIFVHSGI